jgi:hypothetical protein
VVGQIRDDNAVSGNNIFVVQQVPPCQSIATAGVLADNRDALSAFLIENTVFDALNYQVDISADCGFKSGHLYSLFYL